MTVIGGREKEKWKLTGLVKLPSRKVTKEIREINNFIMIIIQNGLERF